jgi:hypothetical protein
VPLEASLLRFASYLPTYLIGRSGQRERVACRWKLHRLLRVVEYVEMDLDPVYPPVLFALAKDVVRRWSVMDLTYTCGGLNAFRDALTAFMIYFSAEAAQCEV